MHKHLQNLQRLCQKLETRYGEADDLVMQLKRELASLAVAASKNHAMAHRNRRKQDQAPAQAQ